SHLVCCNAERLGEVFSTGVKHPFDGWQTRQSFDLNLQATSAFFGSDFGCREGNNFIDVASCVRCHNVSSLVGLVTVGIGNRAIFLATNRSPSRWLARYASSSARLTPMRRSERCVTRNLPASRSRRAVAMLTWRNLHHSLMGITTVGWRFSAMWTPR